MNQKGNNNMILNGWKILVQSKGFYFIMGVLVGMSAFYFLNKNFSKNIIESKYKQITPNVAQLQVKSEEDIDKQIQQNWKQEKKYLENQVEYLSTVIFQNKSKSRITDNFDKGNKNNFFHEIYYADQDSPPIGYIILNKKGQVISKTYNHDIQVNYVLSKNKKGKYVVLSKANLVIKEDNSTDIMTTQRRKWINNSYPLKIKHGEIIINNQEKAFFKNFIIDFAPNLSINYLMLLDKKVNFHPSLGLNFFSISNNRGKLLTFPEILIGASSLDNYSIMFSPVNLNIGNFIPLIKNTYIKPIIGMHNKNFGYGIGIGINF